MKKSKEVNKYISASPKQAQTKLKQIRQAIIQSAPNAIEKMSYGMPYYGYNGRLAYFRFAKYHIGLYIPPPIIKEHKKELAIYKTATSTIQFPLDKKLPLALIKKLVKARIKYNERN